MKHPTYLVKDNNSAYGPIDKQFLQSVINTFEQDPDIDLQQLSIEMKMSKATLYRRIKSITGLPPIDFIKKVRMKKACGMLLNKSINISETAYIAGFSDPKYFSRCFKKEFGLTPSEYKKSMLTA